MDISRNHSLPRIGPTSLDVNRPVEQRASSVPLTLLGRTYSITPRNNGMPLSGESLAAFQQACKPFGEVSIVPGRGGEKRATYRAHWQPQNSAAKTMMDVIVHLDKNDMPKKMQASEMNFDALVHDELGRSLFEIRIHNGGAHAQR